MKSTASPPFSFDSVIRKKKLHAKVHDVDHINKGMLVDTDYIIEVKILDGPTPTIYMISKTYKQFRVLSKRFREASEVATAGVRSPKDLSNAAIYLIRLVDDFAKLIDSERVEYLAKVSLKHVKQLSIERSRRIDDALQLITQTSTPPEEYRNDKGVSQLIQEIEDFFWSDHVVEEGATEDSTTMPSAEEEEQKQQTQPNVFDTPPSSEKPPVLRATSTKLRRSVKIRFQDLEDMKKLESEKGTLFLAEEDAEDDLGNNKPAGVSSSNIKTSFMSTKLGLVVKIMATVLTIFILRYAKVITVKVDGDYALFLGFILFATGFQISRLTTLNDEKAAGKKSQATIPIKSEQGVTFSGSVENKRSVSSLALLRKSMSSASVNRKALLSGDEVLGEELLSLAEEEDDYLSPRPLLQSPLAAFPPNGDPEIDLNCVSEPKSQIFHVRGPAYLVDRKKILSEEMLFPFRGADLLLTDECPEHVARNSALFGGNLRKKSTFLVNFRLPWGVFVLYFEIPDMFVPFLRKGYEPNYSDELPSLDDMNAGERCACRFLLGDAERKKQTLKLIPHVEIGPWLVKNVVGSTPAIIGNKLPVNYIYQPSDGKKCCYLEADLDIVASSAARKILSVVRSYTQGLTIDLGFVCEGKQPDELPEQMLCACRVHGLDPLNASLLPPMPDEGTHFHADQ